MTPRNSLVSTDGLDFLLSNSDDFNHLLVGLTDEPALFPSWNGSGLPSSAPASSSAGNLHAAVAVKSVDGGFSQPISSTIAADRARITGNITKPLVTGTEKRPPGYIGAYTPEERRRKIEKFLDKRTRRVWTKKVKYDVRKNFADSRLRIKVSGKIFVSFAGLYVLLTQ